MAQPTDPQELSVVIAQDCYETAAIELRKLLAAPLPEDADVSTINLWVIDAKVHWESCTQYWRQAKVTSLEWRKLEYKLLEVFSRVPDDLVAYSCMEYNELAKRALQFSMDVVPVPLSQMLVQPSVPKESTPLTAPHGPRTATPASVSSVPPTRSASRSFIIPPSPALAASQLPKVSSLVRPRPILNKSLVTAPADALTSAAIFRLDSDSPLRPRPSSLPGPGVTKSVAPSEGSIRSSRQLLVVNAASHPQVLPGPDLTQEDDEEEVVTPGAANKGKEKAASPGFDDEDDDRPSREPPSNFLEADEDEDTIPPLLPSALFKLLGAPINKKRKRASWKRSKFANPLGSPLDSAVDGTATVARSAGKTAGSNKETDKLEGPSRIKPPLTTMGVKGGRFGEAVPKNLKPMEDGLKNIRVLVVSRDFGQFIEVDDALWNKSVAPFVGELYVQPCDQCKHKGTQCHKFLTNSVLCVHCHYGKLPCQVNKVAMLNPIHHYRPKAYETINTFESSMDTLTQHANALEDIVVNYMAGLDTMTQLQGLRTQIGHLRECLGSNTGVEEVAEDDDGAGSDVDDVAEGEAGPSQKCKWSQR
ncbi:hypothetical protein IW261DRAFT_1421806 [Armillaria novae-zelandiae]|uniref:Zn(2)-C6 fungal-type domain-containing protein n=1 Tax=Armillaria novae-zelandiae TaxID=153914 RepID=A0AA39P2W9_9AGAR|nr:hypothetical protein IW261DRAFT_1421806 [Armillaria novae-zelandiae]